MADGARNGRHVCVVRGGGMARVRSVYAKRLEDGDGVRVELENES